MKLIFTIIIGLMFSSVFSQTTKIEYEMKRKIYENEIYKFPEYAKKPLSKKYNYLLIISNEKSEYKSINSISEDSIYSEEELTFLENQNRSMIKDYFKDLKNNLFYGELSIFGNGYHVKDSLFERQWEITSETKDILNYKCKKAVSKKFKTEVVAWFTEEINIKTGPDLYDGLPGIILEIDNKHMNITAVKLETELKTTNILLPINIEKVYSFKEIDKITSQPQTSTFTIGNTTTTIIRKKVE